MSSRADVLLPVLVAAVRAGASVALGLFGQALVLGCDRVPILPPTEATPARLPTDPVDRIASLDTLATRWRRAVERRPLADRGDVAAVYARVAAIREIRRAGSASRPRDGRTDLAKAARREP